MRDGYYMTVWLDPEKSERNSLSCKKKVLMLFPMFVICNQVGFPTFAWDFRYYTSSKMHRNITG